LTLIFNGYRLRAVLTLHEENEVLPLSYLLVNAVLAEHNVRVQKVYFIRAALLASQIGFEDIIYAWGFLRQIELPLFKPLDLFILLL
jgi:hypothetical protein